MAPSPTLYRRESCSLCELAEMALRDAGCSEFSCVDVGWHGELADRCGWRIPVVRHPTSDAELDWPFDAWSVRVFLAAVKP